MRGKVHTGVGSVLAIVPVCAGWLGMATTRADEAQPSRASTSSPLPLPAPVGGALAGSVPPLSPDLVAFRAWQTLAAPLGGAAAVLVVPSLIGLAAGGTGESKPFARVRLRCFPPRCGAIVVARF
jgi:hypothetical protein